jgi:hypothetical protein
MRVVRAGGFDRAWSFRRANASYFRAALPVESGLSVEM